ncbi:MAG TPA: DUF2177 family protein [Gemmatimonadota bacterium]|nr:DUF2177 family protein [Gemmatimonadota bacterium]
MTAFLRLYSVSIVAFLVLDAVWLGLVARNFYRDQMGDLLRSDPRWGAAGLFYALFVAGIVVFVTLPAVERASIGRALVFGGLFGLITYATYDLTNLAVLRGFPTLVAVVDLAWGATISAAVATIGYWAAGWLGVA